VDLHLVGIKASGLRCAEIDIDLGADKPSRFTFLQMPNGTGKTTIAECLRAALSGEAASWDSKRICSLQRRNSLQESGHFEARFLMDGRHLAIGMNFSFVDGTCAYYTTLAPRGRKPKHELPAPLGRFSDPQFVRLYIFDAELPQQLLEPSSQRAEQAIDAFYQLYVLRQISDVLEKYFDRTVDQAGASTTQGLTRAKNRLDQLGAIRDELERRRSRGGTRLQEVLASIQSHDEELEQHLGLIETYRAQKVEAEDSLTKAQETLDASISQAFARLQEPLDAYPEARTALDGLAASLDSLRLPEATSRQFFQDLVGQKACICGRPMDEDARAAILLTAHEVLQDESAGVINAFKNDVRTLQREEVCRSPAEHAATLTRLLEVKNRAATRLEQLRDDASARADKRAQELNSSLIELRTQQENLEKEISEITREPRPGDDEHSGCLKWFDSEIKRLKDRVAIISNTVTLRDRKEKLQQTLRVAQSTAIEAARKELVDATNERLSELLPDEDVRVSEIGPSLKLEKREGLNLGAMLSVGYAFLTTLFQHGNHSFPFIVDAPSMGLDGLAREALANLMPSVTKQFVGFVLDNERDFVRTLYAAVPGECKFYTVFSDTSRNRPLREQVDNIEPAPGGTFVIEGFDFFNNVQWTARAEEPADA
jgi:DNA sulfur modification protein DndD